MRTDDFCRQLRAQARRDRANVRLRGGTCGRAHDRPAATIRSYTLAGLAVGFSMGTPTTEPYSVHEPS